jgi:ribosomal RNA assembly protein
MLKNMVMKRISLGIIVGGILSKLYRQSHNSRILEVLKWVPKPSLYTISLLNPPGLLPSMDEHQYEIKIPKERIAVLIGEKGEKKRELEESLKVKINVDSEEGDVTLTGKDAIALFTAREVVKAIARGFNPDIAKQLLKTEYQLEIVNISDYAGSKDQMTRLKGRVIGEGGKSRSTIEELAEVSIVIYGKTIGIIGQAENVTAAKRAVDALLTGAPHSTVFRLLEKLRRDMKRKDLEGFNQKRTDI